MIPIESREVLEFFQETLGISNTSPVQSDNIERGAHAHPIQLMNVWSCRANELNRWMDSHVDLVQNQPKNTISMRKAVIRYHIKEILLTNRISMGFPF